ncbi:MAG: S8 family serine peptidase, partial [Planctomycetota bacterium]
SYDPNNGSAFQVDLRCYDLSALDLSSSLYDLLHSIFNSQTTWPPSGQMPPEFDWQQIMELGRNPGLGVRNLHAQGVTGLNVGIAIIDKPLLTEHQEYAECLRLYEEINIESWMDADMHGGAVASIAVGQTVGVAPEADLYYIAALNYDLSPDGNDLILNYHYYAQGIRRILEINEQLPEDRKIRVISISAGWRPEFTGYDDMMAACEEAIAAGMLIVCSTIENIHDSFDYIGFGRYPLADPDNFESYGPGLFWAQAFYDNEAWAISTDRLLVPMDSRTTASPCGEDEFVWYSMGGVSWAIPYIAGVYALAVQANPEITPDAFGSLAMDNGRVIDIVHNDETIPLGTIIDPVALINNINNPPINKFDDVRARDLSAYDFSNRPDLIDTLTFNQDTVWPEPNKMPPGCDPDQIMTDAMNPGLGVRSLHQQGITGAGVNVAIIDQPIIQTHPEYNGKIAAYYDVGCGGSENSMHGPAMTSLLVGENCGTAPGAQVYYVAAPSWHGDAAYYADALDWIVTQNESLPAPDKIRVVSVSSQPSGLGSVYSNQEMWDAAVANAQAAGILVLDCTWHHGFVSLCWYDANDPENVSKCTPGFRDGPVEVDAGHIHAPTAPRTEAEVHSHGNYGYIYDGGSHRSGRPYAKNGYSGTIPYCAGVLAMGWQIEPELTGEQMRHLLLASAYINGDGAHIINPPAFVNLLVEDKPSIQLSTKEFVFSAFFGDPGPQVLSISNGGLGTLNWVISETCDWLEVEPNTGSSTGLADANEVTLSVTDLPIGIHNCELTVSDPCAINNPQTVEVTVYVIGGGDGDGELRYVPSEYGTIQAAIDDCNEGDIVVIEPGTYTGTGNRDLDFKGKAITVRSADPNDSDVVSATVIDCNGTESEPHQGFYFHTNEDANSVLSGLTITGAYGSFGGAIRCNNSSPMIVNCVFVDNSVSGAGGGIHNSNSNPILFNCMFRNNSSDWVAGALRNHTSSPVLINCLFTGNSAVYGGAIQNENGSSNPTLINCTFAGNTGSGGRGGILNGSSEPPPSPVLRNCILWGNSGVGDTDESAQISGGAPIINYSCIQGWTGGFGGTGNIGADPCFADAANDDYHLKSEAGRWDPDSEIWVLDDIISPCIDKGDPASPVGNEPLPNGGRINMGAYGGTAQASKSLTCWNASACAGQPFGDATCDGSTALADLFALKAAFGSSAPWTDPECCADFNRDGAINLADVFVLKANYGTIGYSPSTGNQNCPP